MVDYEKLTRSIRRDIISMALESKSAHVGSALSVVEILTALYFGVMRVNPESPDDENRDRLIFSKGHGCAALYAVLVAKGFAARSVLENYGANGSLLPGHATKGCLPGVEASTGSLGHGLPMAVGLALAMKNDGKASRAFAVLSDGECQEGTTWEAALMASQHKLDNLVVIIDHNKIQGFGNVKDVLSLEPFKDKWLSFGWFVYELDGHDCQEIAHILNFLPVIKAPSAIIAHTVKGKGLSVNEGKLESHYKPPTKEDLERYQ